MISNRAIQTLTNTIQKATQVTGHINFVSYSFSITSMCVTISKYYWDRHGDIIQRKNADGSEISDIIFSRFSDYGDGRYVESFDDDLGRICKKICDDVDEILHGKAR